MPWLPSTSCGQVARHGARRRIAISDECGVTHAREYQEMRGFDDEIDIRSIPTSSRLSKRLLRVQFKLFKRLRPF